MDVVVVLDVAVNIVVVLVLFVAAIVDVVNTKYSRRTGLVENNTPKNRDFWLSNENANGRRDTPSILFLLVFISFVVLVFF